VETARAIGAALDFLFEQLLLPESEDILAKKPDRLVRMEDDAVAIYERHANGSDEEAIGQSLLEKGATLGDLNQFEAAITIFDDLISRFGITTNIRIRENVALALSYKAGSLYMLGRREEAIAIYDDLLGRNFPFPFIVASAIFFKGNILSAISFENDTFADLGSATEPSLHAPLVSNPTRNEEAIAAFDDLLARFGSATELSLRALVAKALVSKAIVLGRLGRNEMAAIRALNDLLDHFGSSTELPLRELIATALTPIPFT
jgi:tetratricopeptide (TPR) repeat protein